MSSVFFPSIPGTVPCMHVWVLLMGIFDVRLFPLCIENIHLFMYNCTCTHTPVPLDIVQ